MRVAFLNRNPETHPGGDLIMLDALMTALRKIGVQCDNIYGEWTPARLRNYDVVHIQHINFTWSADNIRKTLLAGTPYVLLPIFYPTPLLGMSYPQIHRAMAASACVCPLSFREAKEIARLTGYTGPFCIIPHGTDSAFHFPDGGERNYVMTACARGGKGERLVEQVCRKLGLSYCHVMNVPHKELPGWYRKAKVFVHSSPDDRMSLTVGEALCAGCRVISSTGDRGNEWFPDLVAVDPENEVQVGEAIEAAWRNTYWSYLPNQQARKMSWLNTAVAFKAIYERALRC